MKFCLKLVYRWVKRISSGADFLSVIRTFFLSNYGPGQALRDNRVKQFATKPGYTNGCCCVGCRLLLVETPILHYPARAK